MFGMLSELKALLRLSDMIHTSNIMGGSKLLFDRLHEPNVEQRAGGVAHQLQ